MNEIETSIERARLILRDQFGGRKSKMAKEAGLSLGTLRDIESEAWNPTAHTLRSVLSLEGEAQP